MIKFLPYILGSVLLNSFAQILIRKGMLCVGQLGKTFQEIVQYVINTCFNLYIICGMICYAISIFLWMYVLSKVNVSLAYPMQSFGYIIAMFVAFFTLGEPLSFYKILGTFVICLGVFLISISPDAL